MADIVQREHPVLRGTAEAVPLSDISSPRIKKILSEMQKALDKEEDGVAIAAPQINVPLRIFIVSARAFEVSEDSHKKTGKKRRDKKHSNLVFINPVVTKLSKEKEWMDEGCLSVRWAYGKMRRSIKATIEAYDENGKKITRGASGLLAQIFQHEVDHLNGVLFTDRAKNVREIPPEEQNSESRARN